jgi:ATP-dependent exoDNAse (exonuclease V) beta subunit
MLQAREAERTGRCRRETPITLCAPPDGRVIEGIVDLAFEQGGSWTVVDFKTAEEEELPAPDRM